MTFGAYTHVTLSCLSAVGMESFVWCCDNASSDAYVPTAMLISCTDTGGRQTSSDMVLEYACRHTYQCQMYIMAYV